MSADPPNASAEVDTAPSDGRAGGALTVLLVEPWFGGSHRQWAQGWAAASRHQVSIIGHQDQFWRWRLRGASLTLAEVVRDHAATHGRPDRLVVSDMVDVAALLGFCRHELAGVPVVVYFHENQLTYRTDHGQQPSEGPTITNWLSAAAADATWFNSEFHRSSFFDALPGFLDRMPDHRHSHLVDGVRQHSQVQPVGLDLDPLTGLRVSRADQPTERSVPRILWNQRWDHDKNPQAFFRALGTLADEGVDFRVSLAGENRRSDPQEFTRFRERFGDRIDHVGHLPTGDYHRLLGEADVVVSTALQEFFGVSVVEAIVAGAVPLLPKRLSYPEIVPKQFHDEVLYGAGPTAGGDEPDDHTALVTRLREMLSDVPAARARTAGLAESLERFDWRTVAPAYDSAIKDVVSSGAA